MSTKNGTASTGSPVAIVAIVAVVVLVLGTILLFRQEDPASAGAQDVANGSPDAKDPQFELEIRSDEGSLSVQSEG